MEFRYSKAHHIGMEIKNSHAKDHPIFLRRESFNNNSLTALINKI